MNEKQKQLIMDEFNSGLDNNKEITSICVEVKMCPKDCRLCFIRRLEELENEN